MVGSGEMQYAKRPAKSWTPRIAKTIMISAQTMMTWTTEGRVRMNRSTMMRKLPKRAIRRRGRKTRKTRIVRRTGKASEKRAATEEVTMTKSN